MLMKVVGWIAKLGSKIAKEKTSETAAAHPRAASCGASKAPPHENGTRQG